MNPLAALRFLPLAVLALALGATTAVARQTPAEDPAPSPRMISFENDSELDAVALEGSGSIETVDARAIHGDRSLRWTLAADAALRIDGPVGYVPPGRAPADGKTSILSLFVHQTAAIADGTLVVELGRGTDVDCTFELGLDFTGWRTAFVSLREDMTGRPVDTMDTMRLRVRGTIPDGASIDLDRIVLGHRMDARLRDPDLQAPEINAKARARARSQTARAPDLVAWALDEKPAAGDGSVPDAIAKAVDKILQRLDERLLDNPRKRKLDLESIGKRVAFWNIREGDGEDDAGTISGRPIHTSTQSLVYPEPWASRVRQELGQGDLDDYTLLMHDVALAHRLGSRVSDPRRTLTMYANLCRHLIDQGFAAGSSLGSLHDIDEAVQHLCASAFLMREGLREEGLLSPIWEACQWLGNSRRVFREALPDESNLEILGELALPNLLTILIDPNDVHRAETLRRFARKTGAAIAARTPGTLGGFKADGTAFHNGAHYPAYALPAFEVGTTLLRVLAGTPFALSDAAHANLRRAVLATRIYSNPEWGVGLAGRFPFGGERGPEASPPGIRGLESAFIDLARGTAPGEERGPDAEVAGAYLRLWAPPKDEIPRELASRSLLPEQEPRGHWSFNHGCFGIHRHDGRMVTLKGFSRYVWSTEITGTENRFGRYASHGSVQIIRPGGAGLSGFAQDGWDWNRVPGATIIRLPLDLLESAARTPERPRSGVKFAGSSNLAGEAGIFGMVLEEPALKRYDPTFHAKKSVFCFEDRIVCLGSDIRNESRDYPTETVLFQQSLRAREVPTWLDSETPTMRFPLDRAGEDPERSHWFVDTIGNGYRVAPGATTRMSRRSQKSRDASGRDLTRGNFAAAWIDHGKAPRDAGYEYCILLGADARKTAEFDKAMNDPATAPYEVLRRDEQAHIVRDRATATTGFVFFDAIGTVGHGIRSVDRSCLVMMRLAPDGQGLTISVCDPDLRLPGRPTTLMAAESESARVTLELDGNWAEPRTMPPGARLKRRRGSTALTVTLQYGLPVELALRKR